MRRKAYWGSVGYCNLLLQSIERTGQASSRESNGGHVMKYLLATVCVPVMSFFAFVPTTLASTISNSSEGYGWAWLGTVLVVALLLLILIGSPLFYRYQFLKQYEEDQKAAAEKEATL